MQLRNSGVHLELDKYRVLYFTLFVNILLLHKIHQHFSIFNNLTDGFIGFALAILFIGSHKTPQANRSSLALQTHRPHCSIIPFSVCAPSQSYRSCNCKLQSNCRRQYAECIFAALSAFGHHSRVCAISQPQMPAGQSVKKPHHLNT